MINISIAMMARKKDKAAATPTTNTCHEKDWSTTLKVLYN